MEPVRASLSIRIGPLRYEFVAHDPWGQNLLTRLQANLDCVPFAGQPDRIVHLINFHPTRADYAEIREHRLPIRLANRVPQCVPTYGWTLTSDETGLLCWYKDKTKHALGTFHSSHDVQPAPFHLPWQLILQDVIQIGGGILHAGLAQANGRGYLFTAPPGGGKTTALSRLPALWQVLADDATLVWPGPVGSFFGSPLPTWSVMLARTKAIPAIQRWQVGKAVDLAGVVELHKAHSERLSPVLPIQTAQHLYRALSEHPRVVSNRTPFRGQLFHTACDLARNIPCWDLELSRDGCFWEVLGEALGLT